MSIKPQVLFLNRSYYPDAEATGQLLTQLCEDLSLQFDVRVICGQPNSNPSAAPFLRRGVERRHGVTIHRVWNSRFAKSSTVGRLINWFSYLITATWAALSGPRPDIVVVETDPPFLCLTGALLRACFGCQLIVYLQDMHPDLGVALGRVANNWLTRTLRRLFLAVYRRADQVVVLSNDMRTVLIEQGVSPGRICKIPNWVDCSRVKPVKQGNLFRQDFQLQDQFVVMHSGNMGYCQGLENILDAAALLVDRREISILLIGDGAIRSRLEALAAERSLTNVRFVDYQPSSRLAESLSGADLHLVSIDPRVVGYVMPSKLYGVLAAGTPLIAIAPAACELAAIVEQEAVGVVVPPQDPSALADRIAALAELTYDLQEMGGRARRLAVGRYDRSISVDSFASLLIALFDAPETAEDDTAAMAPVVSGERADGGDLLPSSGLADDRTAVTEAIEDVAKLADRARQE